MTRRIESYEDFVQQWDDTLAFLREQGMDNGFYRIGDFITADGVTGYSIAGLFYTALNERKNEKGDKNDQD